MEIQENKKINQFRNFEGMNYEIIISFQIHSHFLDLSFYLFIYSGIITQTFSKTYTNLVSSSNFSC